jgi:Mechanosensitive ion channel
VIEDLGAAPPLDTGLVVIPPVAAQPAPVGPELGVALVALLAAGLLAALAEVARTRSGRFRPDGALTAIARGAEVGARWAALICVAGAAFALLPGEARWVIPWGLGALALALGWSIRDVLPDWVAWSALAAEGRLRPGTWVRGEGFEGIVRALRPRVLWVVDDRGRLAAVPNRLVARSVLHTDEAGHPEVEVRVDLAGVPPARARAALEEAVWLSPWLAPGTRIHTTSDPDRPDRWTVRLRIVDLSCRDRFVGTFRERVDESLHRHGAGASAPDL